MKINNNHDNYINAEIVNTNEINIIDDEEINLNLDNMQFIHLDELNLNDKKKAKKECYSALRNIYEVVNWLRNFSIMNGLAFEKIISKCKKRLKEYSEELIEDPSSTEKFLTVYVDKIENLREEVVKTFSEYFFKGNLIQGHNYIKSATPVEPFKDYVNIIMLVVIGLIFISYFLLTYLKSKLNIKIF